jgi:hypothetical protein
MTHHGEEALTIATLTTIEDKTTPKLQKRYSKIDVSNKKINEQMLSSPIRRS